MEFLQVFRILFYLSFQFNFLREFLFCETYSDQALPYYFILPTTSISEKKLFPAILNRIIAMTGRYFIQFLPVKKPLISDQSPNIDGNFAASTSTGGVTHKRVEGVGDSPLRSPLPESGAWAEDVGACSTTGHGEGITKALLAHRVVQGIRSVTLLIMPQNSISTTS